MPNDITKSEPLAHLLMGLYDVDTGVSLTAERIIDITDVCQATLKNLGQTIIKYGMSEAGVIAQLEDRYEHGNSGGAKVHYYPSEMGFVGLATDEVFLSCARMYGCDALLLAETVFEFMPGAQLDSITE